MFLFGAAALQMSNMHPTKQVHSDNFQFCTKPMLAVIFAVSSFRQLACPAAF
jgi:hypothetical protein